VTVLLMMMAGGAGAVARFTTDEAVQRRGDGSYPWGTFWVNVSGCLLLGLIWGFVDNHSSDTALQTIAGTGFCGGFTTFSTFSVESIRLVETQRYGAAARYVGTSLVVGALAAAVGLALGGS
jgi:fluoride exporter